MTSAERHRDLLEAVRAGEFTYSPSFRNGYLRHGEDPGYLVHSRVSQLHLDGYVTYDDSHDPALITLTGAGERVLP